MNTEKIVITNSWNRNRIIAEQLIENYRLVREERITARKIALIFDKIVFMEFVPNPYLKGRFKKMDDFMKKLEKESVTK